MQKHKCHCNLYVKVSCGKKFCQIYLIKRDRCLTTLLCWPFSTRCIEPIPLKQMWYFFRKSTKTIQIELKKFTIKHVISSENKEQRLFLRHSNRTSCYSFTCSEISSLGTTKKTTTAKHTLRNNSMLGIL